MTCLGFPFERPARVTLAASGGGHLDLLWAVRDVVPHADRRWITTEGPAAQRLRAADETVGTVAAFDRTRRPLRNPLVSVGLALRTRPRVVITSGAGVVFTYTLIARLLGARVIFVETMARVQSPSLTGRLARRFADRVLVQWPELRDAYPEAVVCRPALLPDRIALRPDSEGTFIAAGTHHRGFDRLLALADRGASAGLLPTPLVAQSGASRYEPQALEPTAWLTPALMQQRIADARYLLGHAGAGFIATALQAGKRPIVVPRRAAHGEHVDDHQQQLAAKLEALGLVVIAPPELTAETLASADRPADERDPFSGLPTLAQELTTALKRPAGRRRRARPATVFVAWSTRGQRGREIAAAAGGVARSYTWPQRPGHLATAARWSVAALRTTVDLIRLRPRSAIVQYPPAPAALVVAAYARVARIPFVLDSHPASFGAKGDRRWQLLLPLTRMLVRRAALTMVTVPELAETARRWGGRCRGARGAAPVDRGRRDAVARPPADPVRRRVRRRRAGRRRRRRRTRQSGTRRPHHRRPVARGLGDVDDLPDNVTLTGYLGPDAYRRALEEADAVLVLTTAPTSVVRAGCEAVYARRPLIVSDSPGLRDAFPDAVHVAPDAASIGAGLAEAVARQAELVALADAAREQQLRRWRAQLAHLQEAIA